MVSLVRGQILVLRQTKFDSILSEDDSSSQLRDLTPANLIDRFEQQMESDGSTDGCTELGTLSPILNLSPVASSRSPSRSRSPLRVVRANPAAALETVAEEGAVGGDPVVRRRKTTTKRVVPTILATVLMNPHLSTKARKGSSPNPSPPTSSTPTAAMSR